MSDTHVLVFYGRSEGDGEEYDVLHAPACIESREEHFVSWNCLVEYNFNSNGWDCLDGGKTDFHSDDFPPGIYEIKAWEDKWINSDWNTEWESGVSIVREVRSTDDQT